MNTATLTQCGGPIVFLSIWMAVGSIGAAAEEQAEGKRTGSRVEMKLWKEVDVSEFPGCFVCLGDLDGDGRVDFLLYRQGPQSTPGYLVAIDHDGRELWSRGDSTIKKHMPDGVWKEPALRGIAFVFDIDQDGRSEVISEFWEEGKPMLYVLAGATGKIEQRRESPFDLDVRAEVRRGQCAAGCH